MVGGSGLAGSTTLGLKAAREGVDGGTSGRFEGPGTARTREIEGDGLCTGAEGERGVAGGEATVGVEIRVGLETGTRAEGWVTI